MDSENSTTSFKNQGIDDSPSMLSSINLPEFQYFKREGYKERLEAQDTQIANAVGDRVIEFLDKRFPSLRSRERMIALLARFAALMASISVATDWKQVATSMIQFAVSDCSGNISGYVSSFLQLQPESGVDIQHTLRYIRMLSKTATVSPLVLQLGRCVGIATILGLNVECRDDSSWLSPFMHKWAKQYQDMSIIDIPQMIIDSLIFACEATQAFRDGKFLPCLMNPDDLSQRYALLEAEYQTVLNRTHSKTMDCWINEMDGCLNDMFSRNVSHDCTAAEKALYASMTARGRGKIEALRAITKTEPFQEQPFLIVITGGTRSGKTKVAFDAIKRIGTLYGFPHEMKNIAIFHSADRFDSVVNGETSVIMYDEVAAIQGDKNPNAVPFGETLLNNINNISQFALKADLHEKGKIKKNFKMAIICTNVPSLGLHEHMSCPAAGYARINMCIQLTVKPQYAEDAMKHDNRLCDSKIRDDSAYGGKATGDWYDFVMYNYSVTDKDRRQDDLLAPYKTRAKPEVRLRTDNVKKMFRVLLTDARANLERQKVYVGGVRDMMTTPYCIPCAGYVGEGCTCGGTRVLQDDEPIPEVGVTDVIDFVSQITRPFGFDMIDFFCRVGLSTPSFGVIGERMGVHVILNLFRHFSLEQILFMITFYNTYALYSLMVKSTMTFFVMQFFALWLLVIYMRFFKRNLASYLYARVLRNGGRFTWRTSTILCSAGLAISTLAALRNIIAQFAPQSGVYPDSDEEIDEIAKRPNDWAYPISVSQFPQTDLRCGTVEHFVKRVEKNQVRISFSFQTPKHTNALMLDSDTIMFNRHSIPEDVSDFVATFTRGTGTGTSYLASIHTISREESKDLIVARVSNGPSYAALFDLLAEEEGRGRKMGTVLTRSEDGQIVRAKTQLECSYGKNPSIENLVACCVYEYPGGTYPGLCGSSVLDLSTKEPRIIAFHSAGTKVRGSAVIITRTLIRSMIRKKIAYEVPDMEIPFKPETAEPLTLRSKDVHFRCATRYVDKSKVTTPFTVYGTFGFRRTRHNSMRFTKIHDSLTEKGFGTSHGLPVFKSDRQFSDVFQRAVLHQMTPVPQRLLSYAQSDYLSCLAMIGHNYTVRVSHPLSFQETLNGIHGVKYVDSVNKSKTTAAGLGFGLKKEDWYEVTLREYGNWIEMKEPLRICVENMDSDLRGGNPITLVFNADLKEEPRPLDKVDKLRVFAVPNVASNIIVKRYFCPIASYMYLCPGYSEQFQGMNVSDRDAHDMTMHVLRYGDRLVEGDYKKYDTMLSKQMILAAGGVFATVAGWIGYSKEEVRAVELIMVSIANAYWNYNGTLVQFNGYNPSGIWITILIAGTCNCLLKRIVYCSLYESRGLPLPGPFREHVSTMTVGDDSLDGVSTDNLLYSFSNIRDEFLKFGITFTGSDKDGHTPDFVSLSDACFCKRSFRFDNRLAKYVMCLDLKSIMRSLHIMHRSDEVEDSILLGNCTNALLELARHDKLVYDKYAPVIWEVMREIDIDAYCPVYEYSYDKMWEELYSKYVSPAEWWELNPGLKPIIEATSEEERSE